uniref:IS3 family transposase n=1 Tax=Corynebacterium urinipleomorphum TaxID=1852380 RepID=UPI00117859B0|nr:IS3 family transposase [Corynebacterium urinipleomorphum]
MAGVSNTRADVQRAEEQLHVDTLFTHLDQEVAAASERLEEVQRAVDPDNPDADALVRRETEYHALNAKLDDLNIAETGLVFGRIDIADEDPENPVPGRGDLDRRYIGRMGMDDRADNYRTLLLDWRAPMARPYYLATTAHPEGVETRRNIRMRGRTVAAVDDEVLSGDHAADDDSAASDVGSEAALLRAMNSPRTGHMQSIVETIQREQDEIIRDPTRGVLVVGGGPGTGKTAVALHRVAYLLYTWRDQLARTGVLVVGPNRTFLDYISRVLPELGETGVVLSTVGDLVPGIAPTATESLVAREVKGSEDMALILKRAVRNLQTVPDEDIALSIDGIDLAVTPAMVAGARTRARRSRKPHNEARPIFADHLTQLIAEALAEKIGADPLGGQNLLSEADIDQLHDDLAEDGQVEGIVDRHFPELDAPTVLADFLSDTDAIAAAAHDYDDVTRDALFRAIDFYDGMPVAVTMSDSPNHDLVAEMISAIEAQKPAGARPIIHSDRGGLYRSTKWVEMITDPAHDTNACPQCTPDGRCAQSWRYIPSLSRRGNSGDNARVEGFFGTMKQERLIGRPQTKQMTKAEMIDYINDYIDFYIHKRFKSTLGAGYTTIAQHRQLLSA